MENTGIFKGKQKKHNTRILNQLFNDGPLSAWSIALKISKSKDQNYSLNSTLTKRLHHLEEMEYIRKEESKWYLRPKGVIAVLINQPYPKKWNPQWTEIFEKRAKTVLQQSEHLLKPLSTTIPKELISLHDFNQMVDFSAKAKNQLDKLGINLDKITISQLITLIILNKSIDEITKSLSSDNTKPSTFL